MTDNSKKLTIELVCEPDDPWYSRFYAWYMSKLLTWAINIPSLRAEMIARLGDAVKHQ